LPNLKCRPSPPESLTSLPLLTSPPGVIHVFQSFLGLVFFPFQPFLTFSASCTSPGGHSRPPFSCVPPFHHSPPVLFPAIVPPILLAMDCPLATRYFLCRLLGFRFLSVDCPVRTSPFFYSVFNPFPISFLVSLFVDGASSSPPFPRNPRRISCTSPSF